MGFRSLLDELEPPRRPDCFPGSMNVAADPLTWISRDKHRILEGLLANEFFERTFFGPASPLRKMPGQLVLADADDRDGRPGLRHAYLHPGRDGHVDVEVADAVARAGRALFRIRHAPDLDRFLAGAVPHVPGGPIPAADSCAWDHLLAAAGYWRAGDDPTARRAQAERLLADLKGCETPWPGERPDSKRQADALRDLMLVLGDRFVGDAVVPRALLNFVIRPFFRRGVWDVDAVIRHEGRLAAVVEAKQKYPANVAGMPCGYFGMNEGEAGRMLELTRALGVPVVMLVLAHPHWTKLNTPSDLLRSPESLRRSLWLAARLDGFRLREIMGGPAVSGHEGRNRVFPVRLSEFFVVGRAGWREPHVDAAAAGNLLKVATGDDWLLEQPTWDALTSLQVAGVYEARDPKDPMALAARG